MKRFAFFALVLLAIILVFLFFKTHDVFGQARIWSEQHVASAADSVYFIVGGGQRIATITVCTVSTAAANDRMVIHSKNPSGDVITSTVWITSPAVCFNQQTFVGVYCDTLYYVFSGAGKVTVWGSY